MKNSDTTGIFQAISMPCERNSIAHCRKLRAAGDSETYQKILAFRRREYREHYPDVALGEIDVHDSQSVILYTCEPDSEEIRSTARIAMDGKYGLPEENILRPILVRNGFTGDFAEIGRFIIDAQASNGELLKSYYRAFYHIALAMDISAYLLVARRKEIPFYRKRVNAHLLCDDIGTSFGSVKHRFCVLFWPIAQTGAAFLNWIK